MAEYIEREALVMSILGLTIVDPAVAQYADAVLLLIQQALAADVAPVRHGMWNDINSNARNPVTAWVCRCSLCGCPQDYKHNFCPNCGAKMDLEDKP